MLLFLHYKKNYKASLSSLVNAISACTSTPTCNMPSALFCGNVYQNEFKVKLSDTLKVDLWLRRIHLDSVLKAKLSEKGGATQVDITIRPEILDLICLGVYFLFCLVTPIVLFIKEKNPVLLIVAPILFLLPFLLGYIPYRMESQKLLDEVEGIFEKATSKEGMKKNNGSNTFFTDIILLAKNTVNKELKLYPDKSYKVEVIVDNESCYRTIIEWERCAGELLVERPDFAPYRYLSLQVVATDTADFSFVYCWYDSEGDSLEVIEEKIIEGIEAGFNY